MGTFIVHSYVVLSALHYAIVFSTPSPPSLARVLPSVAPRRASFNNAHYDNIPLWPMPEGGGGESGRDGGGEHRNAVLIFIRSMWSSLSLSFPRDEVSECETPVPTDRRSILPRRLLSRD